MTPGAWNRQPRTLVGLLILAFTTTLIAASPRPATPSDQLAAFIDEFVAADQEDRAGELSAESFQSRLDRIDGWLEDLRGIDRGGLGVQEEIDWRFAESILMGRKIELEHIRSWRRDPRVYMRFRDLNVAIDKPGEPQGKVDEVVDVLERTSAQLDNGRRNLTVYVPRFQELSVYMAEGARQIFTEKVPEFARSVPERSDEILRANGEARDSLESFLTFLNEELPDRPEGTFAIGEDSYDMMLEHQYLLDYDSAGLFDYGREQYDKTVRDLQRVAEEIDPDKSWRELAEEIKRDYPDPRQMIEAHQEWVDKAKKHIVDNDLVPIPWDERVEVVPRPEYLRKTSYYGNFSGAREKNDEGVYLSRWQINPFEDQWDEETKREYLVEHDWGVIIVTAPHETYAGHHVQGLYRCRTRGSSGASTASRSSARDGGCTTRS